jgi:hypothetical protein
MKKYFLKLAAVTLFVGVLTSCEEDKVVFDGNNGKSLIGFTSVTANLPAFQDSDFTMEVEVGATNKVNHDRAIELSVNQELTSATDNQYTIDMSTLVIPAGEYVGKVKITGHYATLPELVKNTITLDLVSVDGFEVKNPDRERFTVYLFRACPIILEDFVGTYDAVEDGSGEYEVEVTLGDEPGELLLSNVWDVDPDSVTHIYLADDVANPQVNFPTNYPGGTDNYLYDNSTYGPAYVNGILDGSFFDSCAKTIEINFAVAVAAGQFSPTNLVLTKQ